MKFITKNTDYALKAICRIAGSKEGEMSASRLAAELKVPGPFLRKLLQELKAGGFLEARRGRNGGFKLSIPPEEIHLTDVMEAFQGEFKITSCMSGKRPCPHIRACKLKDEITRIENIIVSEINSVTIVSLM